MLKLVGQQKADSNDQHRDNQDIEFAARRRRDRLVPVDIFLFLDAVGRQFESPGEEYGQRQTEHEYKKDGFRHPLGRTEIIKRKIGDLRENPRNYAIGNRNPEHVSSF